MNRKITLIFAIVVISALSGVLMTTVFEKEPISQQQTEMHYIPSDMGKYFPDYELSYSEATYGSIDMKHLNKDVIHTVKGIVVDISDIQYWDGINPNDKAFDNVDLETIKVKVDIKVQTVAKSKTDLAKDDIITITLTGFRSGNQIWFNSNDQYEIGEVVIVHLGEDPNDIVGEDIKFSIAGEHTKYTVQNGKAYNHDNGKGKHIKEILDQVQ